MSSMREVSKENWNRNGSLDHINAGSLQRIADAAEKMAANYIALQNDCNRYKKWYSEEQASRQRLERRVSALQGVITRMKRKAVRG